MRYAHPCLCSTLKFNLGSCFYIPSFSGTDGNNGGVSNPKCGDGYSVPGGKGSSFYCRPSLLGRYVTINIPGDGKILTLCEVEVYSARRGIYHCKYLRTHFSCIFLLIHGPHLVSWSLDFFFPFSDKEFNITDHKSTPRCIS